MPAALTENIGGATEQTYSILQMMACANLKNFELVRLIKALARKQRAPALAHPLAPVQPASRMSSAIRPNFGADVFEKPLVMEKAI